MARKKTSEAVETSEAANSVESEASSAAVAISEGKTYIATWKAMAGRRVKSLKGAIIAFDAEGKTTIDATEAERLSKIASVQLVEA